MSPSSPPVCPLQNPHAALSSLRTHRLHMPSSHITLPASLVAPVLLIAHRPSAPLCTVYCSAVALLCSPSWLRAVLSPLPSPLSPLPSPLSPLPSPLSPLPSPLSPLPSPLSLSPTVGTQTACSRLTVATRLRRQHADCWLFACCLRNGAFAVPLPTSPAPPPHHPTPPGPVRWPLSSTLAPYPDSTSMRAALGPGEKGDVDSG
ncbi:hypothetical protein V8E53_014152 [Lactarius tabidus]